MLKNLSRFKPLYRQFSSIPHPDPIKSDPINPIDPKPENLSQDPISVTNPIPIKTVAEIQAEIEANERKIIEAQEVDQMVRKAIFRGLRATIFMVISLTLYFYVLSTRGKDSRFLKWLETIYKGQPTTSDISTSTQSPPSKTL